MLQTTQWQTADFVGYALAAASLFVWWRAAGKLRAGEPLLPVHESGRRAWNPVATVVALIWLIHGLAVRIHIEWQWYYHQRDATSPLEMVDIQQGTLFRALQWGILLAILACSSSPLHRFGIRSEGIGRQLFVGLQGFLASLVPVGLVLIATHQLGLRDPERQHDYLQFLQENRDAATISWVFVSAVILAPLAEELLFRVILQGAAQRFLSPGRAIALVAILFSAVHGWVDALALLPLALVLGYVFYRRHSYLAVVTIHVLFNLSMLVLQLLTPEA